MNESEGGWPLDSRAVWPSTAARATGRDGAIPNEGDDLAKSADFRRGQLSLVCHFIYY